VARVGAHPLTGMGGPRDAGPGAGRRLRLLSAVAGLCAIVGAAAVTWTSVGRLAPDGAAPQRVAFNPRGISWAMISWRMQRALCQHAPCLPARNISPPTLRSLSSFRSLTFLLCDAKTSPHNRPVPVQHGGHSPAPRILGKIRRLRQRPLRSAARGRNRPPVSPRLFGPGGRGGATCSDPPGVAPPRSMPACPSTPPGWRPAAKWSEYPFGHWAPSLVDYIVQGGLAAAILGKFVLAPAVRTPAE